MQKLELLDDNSERTAHTPAGRFPQLKGLEGAQGSDQIRQRASVYPVEMARVPSQATDVTGGQRQP